MAFDHNATDSTLLHEKTVSSTLVHTGPVIRVYHDEILLPDGKKAHREVARHPGGVVALPILPNGKILFVEQFRYPVGHTLLELPAGKLEPNEDPFDAIQRELIEETGFKANAWEEITAIYTCPGFCDEKLWLYKASQLTEVENPPEVDDEFVHCHQLSVSEAFQKIKSREITDSKTICLLSMVFSPLD